MPDLDELLGSIEDYYDVVHDYERCVRFMMDVLDAAQITEPGVVREALEVARGYWDKNRTTEELENARISCWDYLRSIGQETSITEPNACKARAVISVLYATPPSEDILEILDWFATCSARLVSSTLLESLLKKHFPVKKGELRGG